MSQKSYTSEVKSSNRIELRSMRCEFRGNSGFPGMLGIFPRGEPLSQNTHIPEVQSLEFNRIHNGLARARAPLPCERGSALSAKRKPKSAPAAGWGWGSILYYMVERLESWNDVSLCRPGFFGDSGDPRGNVESTPLAQGVFGGSRGAPRGNVESGFWGGLAGLRRIRQCWWQSRPRAVPALGPLRLQMLRRLDPQNALPPPPL